jgi:peroxiredoxin
MAQLRQDFAEFVERDAIVIAVGPDSQKDFQRFWEKKDMPFIGLADPDNEVAKKYDQEVNLLKFGRIPAQMIVDKNGILQFVHYANSMSDIPDNQVILEKLDKINQS